MRSKLNYLIGVSLNRKVKTKWFFLANALLLVLILAVINIDSIIMFFGGDFDEKYTLEIVDTTNEAYEIFDEQIKSSEMNEDYIIKQSQRSIDELKETIDKEGSKYIAIVLEPSANVFDAKIISKEYLELVDTQLITMALNNTKTALALTKSEIPIEKINSIYEPVVVERDYLEEGKNSEDENMEIIMTTVFPIIILPFFMLSIFLVQMIGAEVNDEKTTRGMEIIISNVSPKTHFFAKVIAGNLFVIIQGVLLFIYAALGLLLRKLIGGDSIIDGVGTEVGNVIHNLFSTGLGGKFVYIIPLVLILMLLTFVAYSLLAGILASMTTNIEDFQQLQTPIMVISLVGYYLAMMAGMFKGALFIKIFAFVPFISAILAPSLLVLGQFGIIEFLISILFICLTIFLLIKYGLRIYKVGILNYSSKDLWKKMFKALKS